MDTVQGQDRVVGISLEPEPGSIDQARQRVICDMIERLGPEQVANMLVLRECKIIRAEKLRDRMLDDLERSGG